MIVSLHRLPPAGVRVQHQYQVGELDVSEHEFTLTEPPQIEVQIRRSGMDLHVNGELQATIVAPCDRCLANVTFPLTLPLKLLYLPASTAAPTGNEKELQADDLAFSYYEKDELSLDQLIREQLELALPLQICCRSDCRGLCAQCGANLNETTCQCAATPSALSSIMFGNIGEQT